jgi:membrane-associated phospholipid phosphatase
MELVSACRQMRLPALVALLIAGAPNSAARADASERVAWQEHWPRVHEIEYVATGVFGLGSLTIVLAFDQRSSGLNGGVLHDDAVRGVLRLRSRAARDAARTVGDATYHVMLAYPFLDALVTAWAVHGSADVAWQMFAIDAEAMALAGFLSLLTDHAIGRARPSHHPCQRDSQYEQFCNTSDEFGSFVSGHSAIAAAGAGLTCAHHLNMPLYGGGPPDVVACGAAIGMAAATGIARIANDRHWMTDVAAALLMGGLIGFGVPSLLHYQRPARAFVDDRGLQLRLMPLMGPGLAAGVVVGRY